jgi:ABC-2 type transport system ATP-binding protein
MAVVEVGNVTYRYGKTMALHDLSLVVPQGALYALLGPNGSGKTTLMQLLMGLRRAHSGRVSMLGVESSALTMRDRTSIGYIAEGQSLPGWMRLEQLEAYLAPLYPTWDQALARDLRARFDLDPHRKIRTLSRGEHMKAALLCTLASRPRLLLMDEPFTGMDALVKDELVQGLLESAGSEGWSVLICSHDLEELEMLADWVGFISNGEMLLSEPMESLRERFRRVEILMVDENVQTTGALPAEWMNVARMGARLSFLSSQSNQPDLERELAARFPAARRTEVNQASLREIFVALAKHTARHRNVEAVA